MNENNKRIQKDLLENLKLNILTSSYTHCWDNWKEIDYVPDYNKFYFIVEGEGWLKINGSEYYPKPGQLFLMPAGVLQSYSSISSNTFKKYWCHFAAAISDIYLFDIIKTPCFIDVPDFEKVKNLFEELIKEHDNTRLHARFKEKALLLELISYFIENTNVDSLIFSDFSIMNNLNDVLKYIQEHSTENITVEQLAKRLHFHPNYFTKVFKKYMGMPPAQYVNKVRLEKAKYLLKTTGLQVNEIAEKTGFSDIYYFSKSFKHYTGFSPSDFRSIITTPKTGVNSRNSNS